MSAFSVGLDDGFIQLWHPKYDETESDEPEYKRLINIVGSEFRLNIPYLKRRLLKFLTGNRLELKDELSGVIMKIIREL